MTYPYEAPASADLFDRAQAVTPGGVNSPVRAFRAVGGTPRFMVRGDGPYLWDADDRRYVDLVCSWGPMILGHRHPAVVGAVEQAVSRGFTFGTPGPGEVELAELIVDADARPAGAAGLQRHRGHDVGDPAGARVHRSGEGREVRRLLPRPRRLAARRRRFWRCHLRAARHPGRHAGHGRRHDRDPLQRHRSLWRRCSPSGATRSPA